MSKCATLAESATKAVIESLGYELLEVEYAKKYDQFNLTFYIDKDGGVSLDDCETVHNAIDSLLDEADVSDGKPYILNVSSPGLDRPLKTARDFNKRIGKKVELSLYAPLKGKKKLEGVLVAFDENVVTVEIDKVNTALERNRIAVIREKIEF